MRIVGGKHRGRQLKAPRDRALRPTADRVREALFDILLHRDLGGSPLEGARVLDVFAGTGALGLEALSRGAAALTAIEQDAGAIACLRANVAALGETDRVTVITGNAVQPPKAPAPVDYVFLDAPYGSGDLDPALAALTVTGWIRTGTIGVVELAAKGVVDLDLPAGFNPLDDRLYGATRLVFWRFEGT